MRQSIYRMFAAVILLAGAWVSSVPVHAYIDCPTSEYNCDMQYATPSVDCSDVPCVMTCFNSMQQELYHEQCEY
jgi:hypothetical protein